MCKNKNVNMYEKTYKHVRNNTKQNPSNTQTTPTQHPNDFQWLPNNSQMTLKQYLYNTHTTLIQHPTNSDSHLVWNHRTMFSASLGRHRILIPKRFWRIAQIRVLMVAKDRAEFTDNFAGIPAQIRWLELEQWSFEVKKTIKIIPGWMRDIPG